MTVKVGVNGLGRVGRAFLRCALDRGLPVVAVNDLADPVTLAHLLARDSTYGPYGRPVTADEGDLVVDGHRIAVTGHASPFDLDWSRYDVNVVVEATGRFRTRAAVEPHLYTGAGKVIVSAPAADVDATIVVGVNDAAYDPERHDIVSASSCTANCAAPMVKVLHDAFGVDSGLLTTVHAYTADQMLLDGPHKDLRRSRSAAVNMIPTFTGAARAVGEVLPALAGRLGGVAVRVPVEDGSLVDLTCVLDHPVTVDQVDTAFAFAARGDLAGVLSYRTDPLVSRDVIGDPASCVFDAPLTQTRGRLVKVFGWYDNEWAYANRLADLAERMGVERAERTGTERVGALP